MGGQIINGNKLAKAGVEASEIQLEASEDQVELSTEQYYWQVVSLKEKLLTLNAIHQMLVELEKDVNNRVRVGAVNRNDLLQVQLRKGEVESSQLEVEHSLSTLSQLLAQHVGIANESIDVVLPADLVDMGKSGEACHTCQFAARPSVGLECHTAVPPIGKECRGSSPAA